MDTSMLPATTAVAEPLPVDRCQMCEHPLTAHDPLSRRYCRATAEGALTRGCICR
jgi:hypothetical protein